MNPQILSATASLALLLGCRQPQGDAIAPLPQNSITCRLASYEETATVQAQGTAGTRRTNYQASFDAAGRLTASQSGEQTQAGTNAFESQATSSFRYDPAGFLQQSITTTQTTSAYGGSPSVSTSTETGHFTYADGRLTTAIHRSVVTSLGTTYRSARTETYQYDSQGQLSQYSAIDSASRSVRLYTYVGGQLTRVTQDGKDQYTIQNGRIAASITGLVLSYDATGRLSSSKSPSLTVEYAYAEGGQAVLLAYPEYRFKGIPFEAVLAATIDAGRYGLVQRQTQYQESGGTRQPVDETIYRYELNSQGLPLRQTSTRTVGGSSPRTEQGTAQYTYRDC